MLDIDEFTRYLKKKNKSPNAIQRCVEYSSDFLSYISNKNGYLQVSQIREKDLSEYIIHYEKNSNKNANTLLWGLKNLFEFLQMPNLLRLTTALREERVKRKDFQLKNFMGVDTKHIKSLNSIGIKTAKQMLEAGKSLQKRRLIAEKTGIPYHTILEYVKLSDLSRIGSVKSIRARMFYDAGLETPEEIASWNPRQLRNFLVKWVEQNNFPGIASLPKECEYTIKKARELQSIVEYE